MSKLSTLIRKARDSAEWRGHSLPRFLHHKEDKINTIMAVEAHSCCRNCGKLVVVTSHPAPNQVEIGGLAIATGCDFSELLARNQIRKAG